MLRSQFSALTNKETIAGADPLIIELVFDAPKDPAAVASQINTHLPGSDVTASAAFEGETDRYIFVELPNVREQGQEPEIFAFARTLRTELEAIEANPVLTDSMYGAAAVGLATDTESFSGFCQTTRTNDHPFGWPHLIIKTPQAWALSRGNGATVAVIDTGHSTHQELSGAIKNSGQRNFVEGGTDALDRFSTGFLKHPGHGTLVCSVVASRGSVDAQGNTGGHGAITGSAPEASILPIRAIKSVINFTQRTIPAAITHAITEDADVIMMAQGGASRVAATERALRNAVNAGLVVVCAAGNCWPKVVFPAAYAADGLCTAVAALTHTLSPWRKTGRGPEVTISAPGENVWGAAKNKANDGNSGVRASQGTTLASSLTAGVAAIWVAHHGGRAALLQKAQAAGTTVQAMFVACITGNVTKPPVWAGAGDLGAGVLDAELALNASLPTASTGTEAVADAQLSDIGVNPTINTLLTHLANHNPEAIADVGPEMADYAGEILWLSHRAGAKARAAEDLGEEAIVPVDRMSEGLGTELAARPALANVLRVR